MAASKLTQTQHDNFMEWLYRLAAEGVKMAEAVRIFNASTVAFQQGVIRRRWYRKGTSVPVNRALLPDA
tara:strand:- start:3012 stop:3218 length:207 start_codon:yes stop_codon:yes gene_type:complete